MSSYEDTYSYLERRIDSLKTNKTEIERIVDAEVFDKQTLLIIYDLMSKGYIDSIHYLISTGKEGNIFHTKDKDKKIYALKIFRSQTSTFKRILTYIEGDPRFRGITGSRKKIISAWASKEYRNLQRYFNNGIHVPKPIKCEKNCLLMEYIGDENKPAPQLKHAAINKPDIVYKKVLSFIVDGYKKANLVHGDMSEYNILYWKEEPILIDCGQALTTDHLNAKEFLVRDIRNINRFFENRNVETISEEIILEKTLCGEKKDAIY
ncbi:MAG: serine protein kinase RIO [archaeon]|nr:serine protein kinase RIO [archaeon]